MGYANNVLPGWLIDDRCSNCDHRVKPRQCWPGRECTECGGTLTRVSEEEYQDAREECRRRNGGTLQPW